MRTRKAALAVLLLALVLVGASAARAGSSANYVLAPEVLASGGQIASSATYSIQATVGQPLTGPAASSNKYGVCSGFWCQAGALFRILLPVILR